MQLLESLNDLFQHMAWADAIVWQAVFKSDLAINDERIKKLIHHLHMVQRAFLNIWRNVEHTRNLGGELTIKDLVSWARDYHGQVSEFINGVTDSDLDRPIVLPWSASMASQFGAEPRTPRLGDTMLQVSQHSTYHRGQINARLRELGETPPLTDFIAWIWFGKPMPNWDHK